LHGRRPGAHRDAATGDIACPLSRLWSVDLGFAGDAVDGDDEPVVGGLCMFEA
jgi:hypothetical protein